MKLNSIYSSGKISIEYLVNKVKLERNTDIMISFIVKIYTIVWVYICMYMYEEGTATHSSVLAWRIPWTEEPDGLQSMGSHRIRHDWSDIRHVYIYIQKIFWKDACCNDKSIPLGKNRMRNGQMTPHLSGWVWIL